MDDPLPIPTGVDYREQCDREAEAREALERRVFDALFPRRDSGLCEHAERELRLAGLYDEDSDYGGALAEAVLDLIRVFASQGHSGMSAGQTVLIFDTLANYRTLSENDHSVYRDVSEYSGGEPMLQDIRDSRWFSRDGGATWENVEARGLKTLDEANRDAVP